VRLKFWGQTPIRPSAGSDPRAFDYPHGRVRRDRTSPGARGSRGRRRGVEGPARLGPWLPL